jgi:protein SCO1/2
MLLEMSREARERIRQKHFPDVVLINQNGQKVRYYTDLLKGRVVVLNFFYAKCEGVCPGVTANLAKVYKLLGDRMGRQVSMYSITLKPEHDTPQVLKEYAQKYHAGPAWMFLTGKENEIEQIRRGMGFVNSDPVLDKDKSQHIGNICYGNEPLTLWGGGPGMTRATWLVKEISSVIAANVKRPSS